MDSECKTPDEWKNLNRTDSFFFAGAKVMNRWFDNSMLSEEEYLEGISKFSKIQLSGRP